MHGISNGSSSFSSSSSASRLGDADDRGKRKEVRMALWHHSDLKISSVAHSKKRAIFTFVSSPRAVACRAFNPRWH